MQFTNKKTTIGMPETPYLLRVNKQVGCFSVGNIEPGNLESINSFGRGKFLEFVIADCDTFLYGTIGKVKEDQEYVFVSAVVTDSDDCRLPKGLLVHFLTYGFEAKFFTMLQAESETAAIFGDSHPQIIRMVFDKSVATQYGTSIKPPSIFSRDANEQELNYFEAAQTIVQQYPTYLPDAAVLYPPATDPTSGELIGGLIRNGIITSLPSNQPQLLLAD